MKLVPLLVLGLCLPALAQKPRSRPSSRPTPKLAFKIVELKAQHIIATREKVKSATLSQAFARMLPQAYMHAMQQGAKPGRPLSIYHSFGETVDVEAGVIVDKALKAKGKYKARSLPAGSALMVSHFGSYATLGKTHAAAAAELKRRGLSARGACWEIYVSDPSQVKDPSKLRTDIYYPVVKKKKPTSRPHKPRKPK